jgi:hypothetical protein
MVDSELLESGGEELELRDGGDLLGPVALLLAAHDEQRKEQAGETRHSAAHGCEECEAVSGEAA